jgi:hypothetical protein
MNSWTRFNQILKRWTKKQDREMKSPKKELTFFQSYWKSFEKKMKEWELEEHQLTNSPSQNQSNDASNARFVFSTNQ